jgi:hypothetical protein
MKSVCANCHAANWIDSFYVQFDGVVDLGNEKFFKPAKEVMAKLQQAGKITKTPFDAPIKWTYYELWHHQGRRARMGASMNGPDYVQWHGFYEIARLGRLQSFSWNLTQSAAGNSRSLVSLIQAKLNWLYHFI